MPMSTAVSDSMAPAAVRRPASSAAHAGDVGDERAGDLGGLGVVGADQHVALDGVVERRPAPWRGRGGTRPRRAPRAPRPGRRRRPSHAGGMSGWNSLPTRVSALAMEMTTLPSSASASRGDRGRGPVPGRGHDDHVGRGGAGVVGGADRELAAGPQLEEPGAHLFGTFRGTRPQHDLVADRCEAHGKRAPRRARGPQHSDSHGRHSTGAPRSDANGPLVAPGPGLPRRRGGPAVRPGRAARAGRTRRGCRPRAARGGPRG